MTNCMPGTHTGPHITRGFCCFLQILTLIKVCDLGGNTKMIKIAKHAFFLPVFVPGLGGCGGVFKPVDRRRFVGPSFR